MSGACEFDTQIKQCDTKSEKQSNRKIEFGKLIMISLVTVFVTWLNVLPSMELTNAITIITVAVAGYPIFKESLLALKKGRINMELSMVIAIIASLLLFQLLPAIVITLFALLSEFIEEYIVYRGRKNIDILYKQAPKKAFLINKKGYEISKQNIPALEQIIEIPVDNVKVGDIVLVREGDNIPIDGFITNGTSTVNQSSITGESMPVEKKVGDFVYAGTINLTDKLEIKCEKESTDTAYAKIIHLVEEAESSKAPIQKLSDKMATRLIQFAIGFSFLTFIITQDLVSTLSVVVVAGACGLAVGTPIAFLASNSRLAKKGIIVKGGIFIENISNAGTVVFDKTGTLTTGKPSVTQIISFDKEMLPRKVLEIASIAERNVNHPLAKAIIQKALAEKIEMKEIIISANEGQVLNEPVNENKNTSRTGRGVSVVYDGHRISAGNVSYIKKQVQDGKDIDIDTDSHLDPHFSSLSSYKPGFRNFSSIKNNPLQRRQLLEDKTSLDNSKMKLLFHDNDNSIPSASTTVFISLDDKVIGAILLEDKLRDDAKEAITNLRSMGIHCIMLTGDNESIAKKIADDSGIKEYYANLLPEDKLSKVKEIVTRINNKYNVNKKNMVIMVGDGINDTPALAESDIGIAMGKSGTDIAIETADVVLMTENLNKIPELIKSSRRTIFTIKQNFFGTLLIDGLGFVLAFAGLLNPLLAALIHVGSEILFMVNSAKLLKESR